MKYDVFISYSRKDYVDEQMNVIPGNAVSKVKDALTAAGITYWFDNEGMYSGDNFTEKIVSNIEISQIFVFLSTENSNKSRWTCKEIASADEFGKYIIPVRIDRAPYNKKVMFRIADLNYIDYYQNPEKGIIDLIASIKAYLAQIQEEANRKKAEEEKKREAERRKAEEEKRKREEEALQHLMEQQELIDNLKLECTTIDNEEIKISLDRKNLLLKAEKIKDKASRDSLKSQIVSSSPIRKKCNEDYEKIKQLVDSLSEELSIVKEQLKLAKEDNIKLENSISKLHEQSTDRVDKEEYAKISKRNKELEKQISTLDKELSIANIQLKLAKEEKKLEQSSFNQKKPQNKKSTIVSKKVHIIYGAIILLLLSILLYQLNNSDQEIIQKIKVAPVHNNDEKIIDSINFVVSQLSFIDPQIKEYIAGLGNDDPKSIYKLGKCFETGELLEGRRNLNIAGKLVHKAADMGYADAQNTLGFYFFKGRAGYPLNYDSSTVWFSEAIKNGSLDAEYNLALAYADGRYEGKTQGTMKTEDALTLYMRSADKGFAKSQITLGIYYYENKKYELAKKMLEKGLYNENKSYLTTFIESQGQFYMGQLYGTGKPGIKLDEKIAFSWYQKSATNGEGYLEAIYYLGLCYQNGKGTSKNLNKAKEMFELAASRGHLQAKNRLKRL